MIAGRVRSSSPATPQRHAFVSRASSRACGASSCFLPSLELQVRLEAPAAGRDEAWLASNLSRELAFLGSHAVHHFAIVALILRLQGVEVPRYFGVSLSTQATWQRSALTSPSTSSLWASS